MSWRLGGCSSTSATCRDNCRTTNVVPLNHISCGPKRLLDYALARREGTDSQMMAMCITDIAGALDLLWIWYLKHQGLHRRL